MQPLEAPDTFHLSAAIGWLELGCADDALAELASITEDSQSHPDVLEARWLIFAEKKEWAQALEAAGHLVEVAPRRASGWLHRAYALRRMPEGGLQKAWDILLPAFKKFPKEPIIPYNLSCYACQLGKLDEAKDWLQKALRVGGRQKIKKMAVEDPDLEPLREEIRRL